LLFTHCSYLCCWRLQSYKAPRPSTCIWLDGIPSFIIKSCLDIFIHLLIDVFNLSVTCVNFPSLREKLLLSNV
jgi:hypothetical protein